MNDYVRTQPSIWSFGETSEENEYICPKGPILKDKLKLTVLILTLRILLQWIKNKNKKI